MVIFFADRNSLRIIIRTVVVATLFFSSLVPASASAKSFKIESDDVKRIDATLDLVKTWGNLVLPEEFKRILNTTIIGAETGTDVSYGLLILSSLNEMEMIDRVVSQRYKADSTQYFNTILNQQANLIGYYKGLGFDIVRILYAKNVGGPISALTLNTFDMTNKIIVALVAIHNIEKLIFYDGLWRYFDELRNGSSYQDAWEYAAYEMGFSPIMDPRPSKETIKKQGIQLQFKDLYDEWGPKTTAFGVKPEIRRQYEEEMRSVVVQAAEAYIAANARGKTESSFVQDIQDRIVAFGKKIQQGIAWVTEKTKAFVGRIGSFIASLTTKEAGAGLIITILDDGTTIEEQRGENALTTEDPTSREGAENDDDRQDISAFDAVVKADQKDQGDQKEQREQRNPQILVPRMLAQQREAEQRAQNLAGLSFEGCKDGQININAADAKALDELAGIGPVKAQSIIEFRALQTFYKVEDLGKTVGIGEVIVKNIKEQGLACAASKNDTSFTPFSKSTTSSTPPAPGGLAGTPTFEKILITEVQTTGTSSQTEEFIELYNPNDSRIELHDWYLQKKTQSATDFSSFVSKTLFEGKIIEAHGYLLIARNGSSYESNADIVTTSSLADNNILALKNPNGEISDKVGWGSVLDYEGSPAQNPAAGKSLARKYSSNYQDTDNNSQDFEEKVPTPKATNQSSSSSSSTDATLPEVAFTTLPTTQSTALFSLGWTGSGSIASYNLQYTPTPSTDGVLQYSTGGTWLNWSAGSTGEISLASTINTVSVTAQDGIEYTFSITTQNSSGNESTAATSTTNISLAKSVIINEIAWAGTKAESSDEWIELYNNTSASVDFTGWQLKSSDVDGPDIELSGSIGATSFYLVERTDDAATTETANLTASFGNGLSNTSCEVLYLYDSSGAMIDQTFCNTAGTWPGGVASPDYISLERINSQTSGATSGNWASNNVIKYNGKDTANNWLNGTPKQANSAAVDETEIVNLKFDEFSTLTLTLRGQPYYSNSQITVPSGKTLAVESGVTVKLKGGAAKLEVQGTLNAVGTAANGITLATYEPAGTSNIWCGLHFTSTSQNSNLQYVTVQNASSTTSGCGAGSNYSVFVEDSSITFKNSTISGGNGYRKLYLKNSNSTIDALTTSGASNDTSSAAIYIDGGNATISNSTFSNNTIGIWNTTSTGAPTISNNSFTNNTYPIKLTGGSASSTGNSVSSNTYNTIFVEGAAASSITWKKDTIPYLMDTFTVNSGKTLTIEAGATIKVGNIASGTRELTVSGNLVTQGSAGNVVTFEPYTSGGNWKRILLQSGSTADLEYTKLDSGGNTYGQGAIHMSEATLEVSNVEIKNSANNAIYSFQSTISGSNLTLTDNTYGFLIQAGNCPNITNVTISGGATLNSSSISCTF